MTARPLLSFDSRCFPNYLSERERLKTIAENERLFASLGLDAFASSSRPASRGSSSVPSSKRKAANGVKDEKPREKKKPRQSVPLPPGRSSMRLRGQKAETEEDKKEIEVGLTYLAIPILVVELAKMMMTFDRNSMKRKKRSESLNEG